MAADHFNINDIKSLGREAIQLARELRNVRERADKLNDVGQHCFTGADYTVLEDRFGLASGVGANFLTLLGYIQEILNTNTTVAGADRLARLDEFVARVVQ